MKHQSTINREKQVRQLVKAHYEPGNQFRSMKYVWRRYALPEIIGVR